MKRLAEFSIKAIVFIDKVLEAAGLSPKYGWILWWVGIDPEPLIKSLHEFRDALYEIERALVEAEKVGKGQRYPDDLPTCARLDAMRPPAISKEHWN